MTPAARHDLEELLASAHWVRGLARGLVRDAAEADDVAQDAWVAAWSRPAEARDARAWLAGVVRHLSRREARSQERRRRRELASARPERVPSAQELVERSEMQERLSAAVRGLDEPYRSTVLLHYAEGLTLERIAELQGVPSSTVRTRLARALERLRARLDREHGGRATWLAALAPLVGVRHIPLAPAAADATLWSFAMGTKIGLGFAALAVVAALVTLLVLPLERSPAEPVQVVEAPVALADAVAAETSAPVSPRTEVEAEAAPRDLQGPPPAEIRCAVSGVVLDRDGAFLPEAEDAHVQLVDALGIEHLERVARDGSYSVSDLTPGRWWVSAGSRGWIRQERMLELDASTPTSRQDFRLVPLPVVNVKLLAPDGQPFWEAAKSFDLARLGISMVPVATLEPPGERFDGVMGSLNNRFGVGQMWWNGQGGVELPEEYWCLVQLTVEPPVHLSAVLYHDVVETQRVETGQDEVVFTLDPAELAERMGSVEWTLVDPATGFPVRGAAAMLNPKGGMGPSCTSDAAGHMRTERVPAGLYDLRISASDRASWRREVDVPRGGVLDLGKIELPRAAPVRGRVLDADGEGLEAEIRFCALPEPGEMPDFGNFKYGGKADGSFELADLAPGRWQLHVKDKKRGRLQGNAAEQMAPNVVVDNRNGPVEGLVVQLERVSFAVVGWLGDDFEGVRLRFFDPAGLLRQVSGVYRAAPMRVALYPATWRVVATDAQGTTLTEREFTLGSEPAPLVLAPDR